MPNPVQMVRDDHEQMRQQFHRFDRGTDSAYDLKFLVDGILIDFHAHTRVERKVFYPAVQRLIGDHPRLDEGRDEHRASKMLILELARMDPGDEGYLEKFAELRAIIEHHMREEEQQLLPAVERAGGDQMETLAADLDRRWFRYRREAAEVIRGGILVSVRGAVAQLWQVATRSPAA